MKIIAQTPNERYLVSMTNSELANVLGEYSKYDIKREFIEAAIKGDVEVGISDIYSKHRLIYYLQKSNEIEKARQELKKLMDALTPIENKVLKITKANFVETK